MRFCKKISAQDCKLRSICLNIASIVILFSIASAGEIHLADSLFEAGMYSEAITEYYWLIFNGAEPNAASDYHFRIGLCYSRLGMFDLAIEHADRAVSLATNDSLTAIRKIDKSLILLASGESQRAADELDEVIAKAPNTAIKSRAGNLRILSEILAGNWKDARRSLESFGYDSREKFARLDSMLSNAANANGKSASMAAILSAVVPGLGQAYCGGWLKAVNALALNGAVGYLTVSTLLAENYAGGTLALLFLFQRYYLGNINQAEKMARQANDRIVDSWRNVILNEYRKTIVNSDAH